MQPHPNSGNLRSRLSGTLAKIGEQNCEITTSLGGATPMRSLSLGTGPVFVRSKLRLKLLYPHSVHLLTLLSISSRAMCHNFEEFVIHYSTLFEKSTNIMRVSQGIMLYCFMFSVSPWTWDMI